MFRARHRIWGRSIASFSGAGAKLKRGDNNSTHDMFLLQGARIGMEQERSKLLAECSTLNKQISEVQALQKRTQVQLKAERAARRDAEAAAHAAAAVRQNLETACERAAKEISSLQEEVARVKLRLEHGQERVEEEMKVLSHLVTSGFDCLLLG
jgi:chromosome segregation ATPase